MTAKGAQRWLRCAGGVSSGRERSDGTSLFGENEQLHLRVGEDTLFREEFFESGQASFRSRVSRGPGRASMSLVNSSDLFA